MVGWIISLVTLFKGLKHINLDLSPLSSLLVATVFGISVAYIGKLMISPQTLSVTGRAPICARCW